MLTALTLTVLAAVVVHNAWREHQTRKNADMNKAKILALLGIIAALQKTRLEDESNIQDLKKQVETLKRDAAELNDPELIAAVDEVIANAATTPPPVVTPPATSESTSEPQAVS